jgi:hypothetical protein
MFRFIPDLSLARRSACWSGGDWMDQSTRKRSSASMCSPPSYDSGFDPRARYSISPIAATPSTQEWDYIRPDVILAKNLK